MSATTEFTFSATSRQERGSAHARRLRHSGKVPAVVYGAGKPSQSLALDHNDLLKILSHDQVFSQIVSLELDGQAESVVIKDLLRHPTKPKIEHIDFMRINVNQKMTMHVPIHFTAEEECPGVKEGGVISHLLQDIEVSCLPKDLPQAIEISLASLELDHAVHLSDVVLPDGVELVATIDDDHNPTVVSIHRPKVEEEPQEGDTVESGDEAAAGEGTEGEAAPAADDAGES